ncbi:MAG: uracil phosphoribosyltransferase [Candidatus Euphemobacter frigidus]|nr:uracil phosphoribosyltransferase [Candidatus Euphemobacter frigidus]MDP8276545.1 uracil phosphoribosyltransferase [Candidatus Euphemobacter frigidus]
MEFRNLRIIDHPLIRQKLYFLRSKETGSVNFRSMLNEVAALMAYEVTRTLPVKEKEVDTPLEKTTGHVLACPVTLIPILRAGLAMCDGIMAVIPNARVGHIGLYRDHKTLRPVQYYLKLPSDIAESEIFIIDPMLATGGSAAAAIDLVKEHGGASISFICLVAAPEGVRLLEERHPEVPVYAAALDRQLNNRAYILPGLGDAGDRLYGTQ